VALWEGAALAEHLGDSGNVVYRIALSGKPAVLRLTDPGYRTRLENEAEVEFLAYLAARGVRVCPALPSLAGRLVEVVDSEDGQALASVFAWAPGELVTAGSPLWGGPFVRAWGRALGAIHRGAAEFVPDGAGRRWHWTDEDLIVDARRYLPAEDTASLRELDDLLSTLGSLPARPGTFGLTHADFGPQNFNYDPTLGVTAFDFGNCCYHWFAADVAIALSVLWRRPEPERDRCRAWLVDGYREAYPLDPDFDDLFPLLLRLRVLYVYLSRLQWFGERPTEPQAAEVRRLRDLVHARVRW
jgi:Ser/Thr protein kinase RdoA (MazF antagonist)